jgi:hypothetical protein
MNNAEISLTELDICQHSVDDSLPVSNRRPVLFRTSHPRIQHDRLETLRC